MPQSPSGCSDLPQPPYFRFPDPEEEAFWHEHLQRLHSPAKIEALCKREHERSLEAFQRGLLEGSYDEEERALIVGTLDDVRRWWALELQKMPGATRAEREWAQRLLAERWF